MGVAPFVPNIPIPVLTTLAPGPKGGMLLPQDKWNFYETGRWDANEPTKKRFTKQFGVNGLDY